MNRSSFNLIDEPWISALGPAGHEIVSLREAFRRSRELRALAGDLPTQDAAVLRLLLAILHRSVGAAATKAEEHWEWLRSQPSLLLPEVDGYLEHVRDRFDLLSPSEPFMQVAAMTARQGSGLVKLIPDVPDGIPFFSTRGGSELASLTFAEAARWLVHCQAYDPAGIKTGMAQDPNTKGGKSYPIGVAWLGRCGLVVVEGDTLHDTLLFNLVIDRDDDVNVDDIPPWERSDDPWSRRESAEGPVDLMTWQARRVLLKHDGNVITDVLLTNGDRAPLVNQHHLERHTAFRRSPGLEKSTGMATVYTPRPHDPTRALWRGLSVLLAERRATQATQPPGLINWIAKLQRSQCLDPDTPVRLRAIGVAYGSNDSVIASTFDDALALHAVVTCDENLRWAVTRAVELSDHVGQLIAELAAGVSRAAGRQPDGPRNSAREDFFFRLDEKFRHWVGSLTTRTDAEEALSRWCHDLRRTALAVADDTVAAGGEAAWKGREANGKHVSSPLAHRWFLTKLRPLTVTDTQLEPAKETA